VNANVLVSLLGGLAVMAYALYLIVKILGNTRPSG